MDKYRVKETPQNWDRLLKERDEPKRQRLSAPIEGVPLKAPKFSYLKKWGLEKYRRPKPEKRLYNRLKSISCDDSNESRVGQYQPISERITPAYKAPLLDSSKVKAYKRKLEEDEQLNAKMLKRKRITEALAKQGIRAKYKKEFGKQQQQSGKHSTSTVDKLLKNGCKRKMTQSS